MVRGSQLALLGVGIVMCITGSLLTLALVQAQDPFGALPPALAQDAGRQGGGAALDVVAVPVQISGNEERLAVITRQRIQNMADNGLRNELCMVVYDMNGDLTVHAARRIDYDFAITNHNNGGGSGWEPSALAGPAEERRTE